MQVEMEDSTFGRAILVDLKNGKRLDPGIQKIRLGYGCACLIKREAFSE